CDIQEVVEEEKLLRRHGPRRVGALDRHAASHFITASVDAEQAARQTAHRVATGLGAEVEDGRGVAGKPQLARTSDELRCQTRLADARVAANDDHPAASTLQTRLREGPEVAQLLVASDQW